MGRVGNLVVVYLLTLTSAQERRCGTLVVHILPQVGVLWEGRSLGFLNSVVDLSLGLLVEFLRVDVSKANARMDGYVTNLQILFRGKTPLLDVTLETANRVLC